MINIAMDLRYALRSLFRTPGFAVISVSLLALGIGANTTVFSVVNAVLLKPVGVSEPERVVRIYEERAERNFLRGSVTGPNFADWRERVKAFESMAVMQGASMTLTGVGEPEFLRGVRISEEFFDTLGMNPIYGRAFTKEEFDRSEPTSVVLTYGIWQRRFGGDPGIVGRSVELNGRPWQVAGILPSGATYPANVDVWLPYTQDIRSMHRREQSLAAVARIRLGYSLDQAQSEMTMIAGSLAAEYPEENGGWTATVVPLQEALVGEYRTALLILLGAVALVLLIACVNVANLLMSRSTIRLKEVAVRTAMGATRRRIVQQLLVESAILAFLGGALSLLVAGWSLDAVVALSPSGIPRLSEVHVDRLALVYTFVVSLLTALGFGLLPAWQTTKLDAFKTLKERSSRSSTGVQAGRIRRALVSVQMALAVMLLVGATLLTQSFANLMNVDPGFRAQNVLTWRIPLPAQRYADGARFASFIDSAFERLRALPGVRSVGVASDLPLGGSRNNLSFNIAGRPVPGLNEAPDADASVVSPGYFETMGIPLLRGRNFGEADRSQAPGVMVVSESFERTSFGGDALGERIENIFDEKDSWEIVGVVRDVLHRSLDGASVPKVYVPIHQAPRLNPVFVLRSDAAVASLTQPVKEAIWSLDEDLALTNLTTIDTLVDSSVAQPRLSMTLMGIMSILALVLSAVGLYGVVSYSVAQRTAEIGLRMAVGASRVDVWRLVVGEGLIMSGVGAVVGIAGALALSGVFRGLLFGISPQEPRVYLLVLAAMISVVVLASLLPARRAMRIDPIDALRQD